MKILDIRNWIYGEFAPTTLAIGQVAVDQQSRNAVRYWNTHSAYKITKMFDYAGQDSIELTADIKNVAKVYPSIVEDTLLQTNPIGTLLGFVTLDSMTTDLIMQINAMEGYRIYMGQDFRYRYERSTNQAVTPGRLYVQNVPRGATKLAVVGLKWILDDEDITDDFILDWILQYTLALTKVKEGNTLRKAQIIGIQNDGEQMLQEGLDAVKDLQEKLSRESQWALLATRK